MKKFDLLLLASLLTFTIHAQDVRTSGTLDLLPGFTAEMVLSDEGITLYLDGPADRWFAIGFGANAMAPGTDVVFYANGSEGEGLYDGHLTGNAPPQEDPIQSWTLISNDVTGDIRSIVASRPLDTGDSNDFVFEFEMANLSIIYAHGVSPSTDLAYHQGNRGADVAAFADIVVSTNEVVNLQDRLVLYPNPTVETVFLQMDQGTQLDQVRIYDAQARMIRSEQSNGRSGQWSFSVAGLSPGIYYLEALSGGERALIRFAVAK